MGQSDLVELIAGGVPRGHARAPVKWVDIGAGAGNFTLTLATLLAPSSTIYAVDSDKAALESLWQASKREPVRCHVETVHADFRYPLNLPVLDGALAANSLHFHHDHARVLSHILDPLRLNGILLVVEYDVSVPHPWIPHPLSFRRFTALAAKMNLTPPRLVGTKHSRWSANGVMYAAVARKTASSQLSLLSLVSFVSFML